MIKFVAATQSVQWYIPNYQHPIKLLKKNFYEVFDVSSCSVATLYVCLLLSIASGTGRTVSTPVSLQYLPISRSLNTREVWVRSLHCLVFPPDFCSQKKTLIFFCIKFFFVCKFFFLTEILPMQKSFCFSKFALNHLTMFGKKNTKIFNSI